MASRFWRQRLKGDGQRCAWSLFLRDGAGDEPGNPLIVHPPRESRDDVQRASGRLGCTALVDEAAQHRRREPTGLAGQATKPTVELARGLLRRCLGDATQERQPETRLAVGAALRLAGQVRRELLQHPWVVHGCRQALGGLGVELRRPTHSRGAGEDGDEGRLRPATATHDQRVVDLQDLDASIAGLAPGTTESAIGLDGVDTASQQQQQRAPRLDVDVGREVQPRDAMLVEQPRQLLGCTVPTRRGGLVEQHVVRQNREGDGTLAQHLGCGVAQPAQRAIHGRVFGRIQRQHGHRGATRPRELDEAILDDPVQQRFVS